MAFNSNTYHANKLTKAAWEQLAEARALRERIRRGEAYGWEAERLPLLVKYARWDLHRALFFRRLNRSK